VNSILIRVCPNTGESVEVAEGVRAGFHIAGHGGVLYSAFNQRNKNPGLRSKSVERTR
jgi:hypothetical protein